MTTKKELEEELKKLQLEYNDRRKAILQKMSEVDTAEHNKRLEELTNRQKSKGLGDTIKKVTNAMGIKQCGGCKRRQEKLNRLFPYKEEPKKDK
jgi:hypothetical protein